MKTSSRAALAFLSSLVLTVSVGTAAAPSVPAAGAAHPPATKVSVGIPLPQAQLGQGASQADLGEPLRQSLIERLRGSAFDLVPLQSRDPQQIDAEAASKHVTYVLYSRVDQKHGGGLGGMFKKLAPMANMLPMLAGRMGGGSMASYAASTVAQNAVSASAAEAQRAALSQLTGSQQSNIKTGDTVTLEYRLVAPGSSSPVGSATLQGKAKADGEDVLSRLIEQLAGAVTTAATSSGSPGVAAQAGQAVGQAAGTQATAGQATTTSPTADEQESGHSSHGFGALGGLFNRHKAPPPSAANADVNSIDCAKIAAMKSANMSLESCEKMKGAGVAYNQAAADPSASRPGDDQMSCEQIAAELKQQSYTAPDKAKAAEAQSAVAAQRTAMAKDQAEVAKTVAAQQAAVSAADAADHATMLATGGLVDPNRAGKLAETFQKQDKAMGDRMNEERRPTDTRVVNSTADIAGDMGQQLASNPRLAKLIQLSHDRKCKRT